MESKALRDERGGVAISVVGLRKLFPNGGQSLEVLTDATFSRKSGEKVAIIGESGSGKSTLLSLIAGLDTPDGGSIEVGAETIHELDEDGLTRYRSTTVGLVFQFHYLLRDFSAIENVMLPAMIGNRSRREVHEEAEELLVSVGLGDRFHHLPAQLSGGERQRVALARSLINRPPLVLADEPTGNLDDKNSRVVEEILLSLVEERGRTLILVTHNRELARRVGDVLQLEAGCLSPV
ncbi:MAG: ABC transporter ATP-binding protein [Spirochaetales bacterium]|nr:ABC transporter ATP-binding protein [Spirochaetales bacterium]